MVLKSEICVWPKFPIFVHIRMAFARASQWFEVPLPELKLLTGYCVAMYVSVAMMSQETCCNHTFEPNESEWRLPRKSKCINSQWRRSTRCCCRRTFSVRSLTFTYERMNNSLTHSLIGRQISQQQPIGTRIRSHTALSLLCQWDECDLTPTCMHANK